MHLINTYIITINIIAFFLMCIDKFAAIIKKQRISENTLLLLSIIGAAPGIFLGMIILRHKIRKTKFLIIVPLTFIITIYLIAKKKDIENFLYLLFLFI